MTLMNTANTLLLYPYFGSNTLPRVALAPNPVVVPNGSQQLATGALQRLSGIFRPAAEVFIASIMVIDVFAMWLPRVVGALFRGAKDNKLPEDANMATKATSYLRQLNWNNAWEETWREICSGPALFFWPTVLFAMARKGFGGRAIELKQPQLKALTDTFSQLLPKEGSATKRLNKAWERLLPTVFAEHAAAPPALKSFLDQWFAQFTKLLKDRPMGASGKKFTQQLQRHQQKLVDNIVRHNRNNHPETRFYQYDHMLGSLGGKPTRMKATELMNNLVGFRDLMRTVNVKASRDKGAPLRTHISNTYGKIVRSKAIYSVLSIGITLAFLSRLVFWAQKNNNYPANRRLPVFNRSKGLAALPKERLSTSAIFSKPKTPVLQHPNFMEWANA